MEGKKNIAQINKSSSEGWQAAKKGKGGSERARTRERLKRREGKQRSVTAAAAVCGHVLSEPLAQSWTVEQTSMCLRCFLTVPA